MYNSKPISFSVFFFTVKLKFIYEIMAKTKLQSSYFLEITFGFGKILNKFRDREQSQNKLIILKPSFRIEHLH